MRDCQRLSGRTADWVRHAPSSFPTLTQPKADSNDTTHQLHRSQSDNVPLGSHSRLAQANRSISRFCSISWRPRIQGTYTSIEFSHTADLLTFRRTYSTCHLTTKVQKQFSAPRSPFSFSPGSPSLDSLLTIKCTSIFQPSLSFSVLQPDLTVGRLREVHK